MSRFVISASKGTAKKKWLKSFRDAGYEELDVPRDHETRFIHPEGSVARIFHGDQDACYIYPPGGTDKPTGEVVLPACFGNK